MRSARRTAAAGLGAVAAGVALAGCVTTQDKNARTLLTNARTLASEAPLRVSLKNPSVKVLGIVLIRTHRADAIVVRLANRGGRPVTDLPISVGVRAAGGKPVYLNGAANIDYYDTHVPLVPPGGSVAWVLPSVKPADAARGRLFAVVGVPSKPASTSLTALPRITASPGPTAARLSVAVTNDSGVPQYGLEVYATAVRDGRLVGAGRGAIAELDGGNRATVRLPLVGTDVGATLVAYAPPTIFK